ncbi:hypothetical protein BAUCODRAFT_157635 [Baudoinia panamericana UAMH 10762]|uniref:Pal1 cell morphology protein n=1 Tax=Baudoinia panamericana (strain UAMH 10762) TaxID=717646 RepID=M2MU93_BAUPA|nr:uncharacterized protein BAUCODRAFT_157635 [Baudoinia panamericana UAMH 10762]EMC95133.1 hypothetical protein BAUCODRAFT_157635 [Baudoinia panamericana UAMH 10762]
MATGSSKEAQAYLIDPLNAPEPSAETGPGSHFRSTFDSKQPTTTTTSTTSPRTSLSTNNPFRDTATSTTQKQATATTSEAFPSYRTEAFGDHNTTRRHAPPPYEDGKAGASSGPSSGRRRTSSLKERFPGDDSTRPLDIIRKDSKKAHRSPHLNKRHLPGPDVIDRLDPALGGRAYHHEGPYDAATLARNMDSKTSPIAALQTTNEEALKATPAENIKDAVERHQPLDGVAIVPPGMPDRFGRTYDYEEGTDMMREGPMDGPGYKQWAGKDYDPTDLKGQSEPTYSLDRALQAHTINDNGIEMEDRADRMRDYRTAERKGTLDTRDPVEIAGDDGKYVDMEYAAYKNDRENEENVQRSGSLRAAGASLKKRIGSLRHRKDHDE